MPGAELSLDGKFYLKVIGGKIAQPAKEGEKNATLREYELKDGTKGSKWEKYFLNWSGVILDITFRESEFGETCNIEFEDAYLQLNTSDRYFTDFAKKVFSADLKKPVVFHPYDMEIDGKRVKGVSLQQEGQKLKNFFYDGTKTLHDFPTPDEAKKSKKTYWKIYFVEVADFLVEKIKELKFEQNDQVKVAKEILSETGTDISLDDLPF